MSAKDRKQDGREQQRRRASSKEETTWIDWNAATTSSRPSLSNMPTAMDLQNSTWKEPPHAAQKRKQKHKEQGMSKE